MALPSDPTGRALAQMIARDRYERWLQQEVQRILEAGLRELARTMVDDFGTITPGQMQRRALLFKQIGQHLSSSYGGARDFLEAQMKSYAGIETRAAVAHIEALVAEGRFRDALAEKHSTLEKGLKSGNEHVTVEKDGKVLASHEGTRGTVDLPNVPGLRDESAKLTVYHNHPDNGTFSIGDLKQLAHNEGIAELHALAHDGTAYKITMLRHDGFYRALQDEIGIITDRVQEKMDKVDDSLPIAERKALLNKYRVEEAENAWLRLDKQGYLKYTVTEPAAGPTAAKFEATLANLTRAEVKAIAEFPIAGLGIGDWFEKQASDMNVAIRGQIQLGLMNGEGARAIVAKRLLPQTETPEFPGMLPRTRRGTLALVRTTTTTIQTQATYTTLESIDRELVPAYRYVAVRDARTTPICRALDGKVFRFDDPNAKRPPQHVNCRSTIVAVPDYEKLGIPAPNTVAGGFTMGSYATWLQAQDAATQNDILGRAGAALFRDGRASLADLVNADGRKMSNKALADVYGVRAA